MLHSRLFMLILATLLIVQSTLGMALHRCHDEAAGVTHNVAISNMDRTQSHCHDDATIHDDATATNTNAGIGPSTAPHGICTCGIAHGAPALVSQFEFASLPAPPATAPLYRFSVLAAPVETFLRPPISLS